MNGSSRDNGPPSATSWRRLRTAGGVVYGRSLRATTTAAKKAFISGVLRREFLAKHAPFKQPAILLLGYPRSGTSWLGDILGSSEHIAYFCEPINRAWLKRHDEVFVDPLSETDFGRSYARLADDAFAGIPPRGFWDLTTLFPFLPFERQRRRLLIKEVNPVAAEFFDKRYAPQTIFLLRHPAAVAESFQRLKWIPESWNDFGHVYGSMVKRAIEVTRGPRSKLLVYERIALDPRKEIASIFSFLDVALPARFDEIIDRYCGAGASDRPHETKRLSIDQVDKWKRNFDPEILRQVREGYMRAELDFYTDEESWKK